MFIRTKTTPNSPRKTVQIVENYRSPQGNIRQRILRHVGVAQDDAHLAQLRDLAQVILVELKNAPQPGLFSEEEQIALLQQATPDATAEATPNSAADDAPLMVDLKQLRETSRATLGFHDVYGEVYQKLGFDKLMGARKVASGRVLKDLVIARIAQPASKRASAQLLQRDFGIEIDSHQIYRMMDHLNQPMQERICALASKAAFDLLDNKVDVLFFDCTTLYFESFDEDDLRQKGFSKDRKVAETQVLLALLVTRAGLPVGYRLYPGSQWEGNTLPNAIEDIKRNVAVDKVVLVADSALFNKGNLALLNEKMQDYLVAARIKNLPQSLQEKILDKSAYQRLNDDESYLETTYQGQRLIVTYSIHRAKKDQHERQKAIEKTRKRYDGKSVKSAIKGSASKFLNAPEDSTLSINEDKVEQAALWDGLHGIATNVPLDKLSVQDAVAQYRGLWQVEETFRLSKHDLRIRPIFHWTEDRIRAHVALCFMALTCIRWLTYTYNLTHPQQTLSAEAIRTELAHAQVSILEHQKQPRRFAIPSLPSKECKLLYKHMSKTWRTTPYEIYA